MNPHGKMCRWSNAEGSSRCTVTTLVFTLLPLCWRCHHKQSEAETCYRNNRDPGGAYLAILSRNPSTSSRILAEKKLGNSEDDGVRDRGGVYCKAFLGGRQQEQFRTWALNQTNSGIWALKNIAGFLKNLKQKPGGTLLSILEDCLSQSRVSLHGHADQGSEERQIPDGWRIRNRNLLALRDLVSKRLQSMNARVTSIAEAPLNVDLDVWNLAKRKGC